MNGCITSRSRVLMLLSATRLRTVLRSSPLLALALGLATLTAADARSVERIASVAFVSPASPQSTPQMVDAFWQRLRELGYVEGHNLVTNSRWAEGHPERLPTLMAEVVTRNPDVIVTYATGPALAARNATRKIPIVVAAMGDPVATGLAASLSRPGGNVTGLSMGYADPVSGKWLEMLRETVPRLSVVVVISNPDNPLERDLTSKLSKLAATQDLKVEMMDGRTSEALNRAFVHAAKRAQAVIVTGDPAMVGFHRAEIVRLAVKHRMPAMYAMREFVDDGGLMAYGPDVTDMFRRAADYVDKILSGANPAELPIEQPTRHMLVVNMKAAREIGLVIPTTLKVRADEVIK